MHDSDYAGATPHTHLIFQLLTELQWNGEKHQCVIEPRHHTLHLMHMTDLKLSVVVFTGERNQCRHRNLIKEDCVKAKCTLHVMKLTVGISTCMWKCEHLQHRSWIMQHWTSTWFKVLTQNKMMLLFWALVVTRCDCQGHANEIEFILTKFGWL